MVPTVAPHFGLPLHSVGRVLHCNDSYSTGVSALARIAERTRKPTLSILSKRCANSHRRRRRRRHRRRRRRHTHGEHGAPSYGFCHITPAVTTHVHTHIHTHAHTPHRTALKCMPLARSRKYRMLESVKNVDAACGDGARPEHSGASFFFTHQYLLLLRQHTRTHALAYTSICISTAYCALCVRYHAKPSLSAYLASRGQRLRNTTSALSEMERALFLSISLTNPKLQKKRNETSKLCALKTG